MISTVVIANLFISYFTINLSTDNYSLEKSRADQGFSDNHSKAIQEAPTKEACVKFIQNCIEETYGRKYTFTIEEAEFKYSSYRRISTIGTKRITDTYSGIRWGNLINIRDIPQDATSDSDLSGIELYFSNKVKFIREGFSPQNTYAESFYLVASKSKIGSLKKACERLRQISQSENIDPFKRE